MTYIRFWLRLLILFVPGTFLVLYFGAHMTWSRSLLSAGVVALIGLVAVLPMWLLTQRIDPSMWSDDEYTERIMRKRKRLEEDRRKREEEQNEPTS